MIFQCMDGTSIEDWLDSFAGTVGRKVSSSVTLKQRRGQLILRIRVINQKEIGMLSTEWQTLSLSQPMQNSFLHTFCLTTFLTTYAFVGNVDWQIILSSKHQILSDIIFLYQCCNNCLEPRPKGALATLFYKCIYIAWFPFNISLV